MDDGGDRASAPAPIWCWQRRTDRPRCPRSASECPVPSQRWGWLALVVMVGVVLTMLGFGALRASRRTPADLSASDPAPPPAAHIELREACANDLGRCLDHLGLVR